MTTEKLPVRLFNDNFGSGSILAILGASDGYMLFMKSAEHIVNVDIPATDVKKWRPYVEIIFKAYCRPSDITIIPNKVDTFEGTEIKTPSMASFDINKKYLPSGISLTEDSGIVGHVKQRSFSYDMTNPQIASIAAENDARISYYVEPPYFKFIQNNLNNSLIKGMALIGKPGTGKSTDAIAAVRSLGGIILIAQLSGGMLENNLFVNTKPNRTLSELVEKVIRGGTLTTAEQETYDLLSKASASFLEVDEVIIRGIKLNCPVLLDEFAYANLLVKARFNVLTDGTKVFRHEGHDYVLPENFFLFFTWNPGDDGTTDIPNALKSRFPIFIVPSLSSSTHYNRIKAFCAKELGLSTIDKQFVNLLYNFGNLVEKDQQKFKHRGGYFTMRATQMFLSNALTENLNLENFIYELTSKFVNPLWGTNFENTDFISECLDKDPYVGLINELYTRYQDTFFTTKVKPSKTLSDYISEDAVLDTSSTSVGDEDADLISKEVDSVFNL